MKFSGTMPSHLFDANKKLGTHWTEVEETYQHIVVDIMVAVNYKPDEVMRINECNVRIKQIQYSHKVILLSIYRTMITTHLCSMDWC